MPTAIRFVVFLCIVFITGNVWAQPAETPASAPAVLKAEPVIKHIPAGAMGFVVVNNIKDSAARVENFLNEIGLGPMLPFNEISGGLVGLLQTGANLSEGFNPNGGFAAILLDPQQFGVDLVGLMSPGRAAAKTSTQPAQEPTTRQAGEQKVPFILLIPGSGVQEVFGNYPIQQAGKYYSVTLRMGPMFAIKCGDYVAISPTTRALAVLQESPKKVSSELSESQAAAIAESGIAMHINMKIAGPIFSNILKQLESQMVAMQAAGASNVPQMGLMSAYMPMYRQMISQLDSVTVTGRFVPTGLVLAEHILWNPQSQWAKMLSAYKPASGKLLDRLPNLPYVLAGGSAVTDGLEENKKINLDMLDKLLASELLQSVPEATRAKVRQLVEASCDQITEVQFVGGGAPAGSGVFGVALVMKCKNAETVRALYGEAAGVAGTMIKALVGAQDQSIQDLKITWLKNVGTVEQCTYDAIDISHPKIDEMSEDERAKIGKILGEERIRLRISAVDDTTVVVTFGGAEPFLAETIKSVRSGGTILDGEQLAEAMKYMPSDRMGILLFSGGNLFDVITRGMKIMDPESAPLPFRIVTKTPIAIGMSASGSEMKAVLYVPNSLIKEVAGIFTMFMFGPPAGTTQPQPPVGTN